MLPTLLLLAPLLGSAIADCTKQDRIRYASMVPYAYSQPPAETHAAFEQVPFGVPDKNGSCGTLIYPNGGGPVPVAVTGNGVVNFGTETRQVFSKVTGEYIDFGHNMTTVIYTNVTLGVASYAPVPVTFSGQVYVDFNVNCRISAVRAYAEVPTYIDGKPVTIYELLPIPPFPPLV